MTKNNIDCCFLVSASSKKSYQKLSETYSAIEPPTWTLLLAQSMRSIGFNIKIIDANAEDLSENEMNRIRSEKISIIFQDPMTSLNPYMRIRDS